MSESEELQLRISAESETCTSEEALPGLWAAGRRVTEAVRVRMTPQWYETSTCDDAARGIYLRHYSAWKRPKAAKNPRFVGPGEAMVLVTTTYQALFVWRLSRYRLDQQEGVECAVFRNEWQCPHCYRGHSSQMIANAMRLVWARWPGRRMFTFVDPKAVASPNPGFCFKAAGWRFEGRTKRGLHILAVSP